MTEYELKVLREAAGEYIEELIPGAAYNSAREFLMGSGYIDKATGVVTNKGYEAMNAKPINRIGRDDVNAYARMIELSCDSMTDYQTIATKSAIYPGQGTPFGLMYAALGLAEAGEVQNKVKKAFRDDIFIDIRDDAPADEDGPREINAVCFPLTPERKAQIIAEIGGALWYIAAVCNEIGATMSEVALHNLEELCSRGERDTLQGDGDNR